MSAVIARPLDHRTAEEPREAQASHRTKPKSQEPREPLVLRAIRYQTGRTALVL